MKKYHIIWLNYSHTLCFFFNTWNSSGVGDVGDVQRSTRSGWNPSSFHVAIGHVKSHQNHHWFIMKKTVLTIDNQEWPFQKKFITIIIQRKKITTKDKSSNYVSSKYHTHDVYILYKPDSALGQSSGAGEIQLSSHRASGPVQFSEDPSAPVNRRPEKVFNDWIKYSMKRSCEWWDQCFMSTCEYNSPSFTRSFLVNDWMMVNATRLS